MLALLVGALAACAELDPATLEPATSPPKTPQPAQSTPASTQVPASNPAATVTVAAPATAGPADGRVDVLFERGGDIYALDLASARSHALTRGLPFASQVEMGDPWALSPDGRLLAMVRNGEGPRAVLTLLKLVGGQAQEVGRYEGRIDTLRWSHDSARLAFLLNRRHERTGELLEQSLRVYDLAAGREAVAYQHTFAADETMRRGLWLEAWAPGNAALYVVYALDRTDDPGLLYVLDMRGGELRLVSQDYLLKGGVAVNSATSQVLLRRTIGSASGSPASPLYVTQTARDGSLAAPRLLSPEDWLVGAVAWSPDGTRVAVERLEPQQHGTFAVHLWLFTVGEAAPRQLTSDAGYREERPAWTPDGKKLIFNRWRATQLRPAGLWSLSLEEAEPVLLDEGGANAQGVRAGPGN